MSDTRGMNPNQVRDLTLISNIPAADIRTAAEEIAKAQPSIKLKMMEDIALKYISQDEFTAVFRWLVFTRNAKTQLQLDRPDLELLSQFADQNRSHGINIENSTVESCAIISESEFFYALYNAHRLSYNAEHVFHSAEIIIDTRPVFDQSRSDIIGHVILPFLKLRYSADEDQNHKSLLLDAGDIDLLTVELDRARRKIDSIKRQMGDNFTVLVGEEAASNV